MHFVAFAHPIFENATGHFARHAIFCDIGLALYGFRLFLEGIQAAEDNEHYDGCNNQECRQQIGFVMFLHIE